MGEICFDLELEFNQAPKDSFAEGRDAVVTMVYPQHTVYSYRGVKRRPLGIRNVAACLAAPGHHFTSRKLRLREVKKLLQWH